MATRAGYGGGSLRRRGDRRWELRVSTGRDPVEDFDIITRELELFPGRDASGERLAE